MSQLLHLAERKQLRCFRVIEAGRLHLVAYERQRDGLRRRLRNRHERTMFVSERPIVRHKTRLEWHSLLIALRTQLLRRARQCAQAHNQQDANLLV